MNLRFTLQFILLATLGLTAGCKKNLGDKETIVAVDKEFVIEPWEVLNELGGSLQLRVATIKNQECGDTHISYKTTLDNNQVIVTLNNLIYPLTCYGFAEPARDTIDLSNIKKGDYPFQLNLKNVVINDGILHVEDARYWFEMKKENGISISKKELLRVPQNSIWGYISTDNGQDERYTQMLDSLKVITVPLSITNGDYNYFTMSDTGIDIVAKFNTQKPNIRRFLLRQTGTKEQLNAALKYFRTVAGIDFMIFTSEGKTYTK